MLFERIFNILRDIREKEEIEKKKIYITTEAIAKRLSASRPQILKVITNISKYYKVETIIVILENNEGTAKSKRSYAFRLGD